MPSDTRTIAHMGFAMALALCIGAAPAVAAEPDAPASSTEVTQPAEPDAAPLDEGAPAPAPEAEGIEEVEEPEPEPMPPAPAPAVSTDNSLVIIAHPSVPFDTIARKDVRRIYLGTRQVWKPGERITVVRLPDAAPSSQVLYDEALKVPAARFHTAWQQLELSGRGVSPRQVASISELISQVAGTQGAIGYCLRSDLPADVPVKVLTIEE